MGTSAPTQIKGIRNINIFRGEIKMKEVGYYNGKIGPLEEMTVPMEDRALYFGDGIYEATCVANRVPFARTTTWTGCTTACGCWRSPSTWSGTR